MNLVDALQMVGPAVAVYVAIRVDLAVLKTRMDYIEKHKEQNPCNH